MQFNSFAAFFSSSFSYLPICIIKKRNICSFSLPSCRWESENGSSTFLTNQCLQFSGCHLFFPWELMLQSTGLQVTSTYHLCWHGLLVFSPWFHIIMASQVVKRWNKMVELTIFSAKMWMLPLLAFWLWLTGSLGWSLVH